LIKHGGVSAGGSQDVSPWAIIGLKIISIPPLDPRFINSVTGLDLKMLKLFYSMSLRGTQHD